LGKWCIMIGWLVGILTFKKKKKVE